MPQERRYPPGALREDPLRHTLAPRATSEDAEFVEPSRDRVADAMRQSSRRREVDLKPTALTHNARCDLVAEDVLGEGRDHSGELAVASRVLDRMPRERAAVADQVAEQREFVVAHRLALRPGQPARNGNPHLRREVVEPSPTVEREELVVPRRADLPSEPRPQAEDRFSAGRKRSHDRSRFQAPGLGIYREHSEPAL